MYDELIGELYLVASQAKSNSRRELLEKAANAIKELQSDNAALNGTVSNLIQQIAELSAKATPKRVGFTGWKGCRDTRYKCPYCNKYVRNDEKYCHKCGQALMFPIIRHTPYVPGKRQEEIISWPDEPPKEE